MSQKVKYENICFIGLINDSKNSNSPKNIKIPSTIPEIEHQFLPHHKSPPTSPRSSILNDDEIIIG